MSLLHELNILSYPTKHCFVPAFAVERAKHPMTFIRKHQSFRRNSISPKRREELKALIDGHPEILFVGNDERRRFHIGCR